jgi:hypothetical protein
MTADSSTAEAEGNERACRYKGVTLVKQVEERTAAAMQGDRRADLGAALLDNVTKKAAIEQLNIKAGDNVSYTDFLEWKSKDLIDDN